MKFAKWVLANWAVLGPCGALLASELLGLLSAQWRGIAQALLKKLFNVDLAPPPPVLSAAETAPIAVPPPRAPGDRGSALPELLMLLLAVAAYAGVLGVLMGSVGCTAQVRHAIAVDFQACEAGELPAEAKALTGDVEQALLSTTGNWQARLDGLAANVAVSAGTDAVVDLVTCAVDAVRAAYAAKVPPPGTMAGQLDPAVYRLTVRARLWEVSHSRAARAAARR